MNYRAIPFVSPEDIFAEVKEELRSYFKTGAVDDLYFERWTHQAMSKFQKSAYPIKETFLPLNNFMADLPCDFNSVRELWVCGTLETAHYQNPTSYYYQKDCRVTRIDDRCHECFDEGCPNCCDPCSDDNPINKRKYQVTYKSTGETWFEYKFSHLLRPGNKTTLGKCSPDCFNKGIESMDTFAIEGNKLMTSFRDGNLHLVYYSDNSDEAGVLIPDKQRVKEYIHRHLVYKIFQQLANQVVDETFNQIQMKKQEAKQEVDEAYILALIDLRTETIEDKRRAIKKVNRRFGGYTRSLHIKQYY